MSARCNKFRSKKQFMLKKIPQSLLNLKLPSYGALNDFKVNNLNPNYFKYIDDLLKLWIELPPGTLTSFITKCYGYTKIADSFYMITDLIQDDTTAVKKKHFLTFEPEKTSESLKPKEQHLSQNAYDIIASMNLGNLAAMKNIPKYLV